MMAVNKNDKHTKGRTAKVVRTGCTAGCEPRPEISNKCKTREKEKRPIQGKPMHPCLD